MVFSTSQEAFEGPASYMFTLLRVGYGKKSLPVNFSTAPSVQSCELFTHKPEALVMREARVGSGGGCGHESEF